MKLTKNRAGEWFIIAESLLWGAFPIVTRATYQFLQPIHALAYATLTASVFFGVLFLARKEWKTLTDWNIWKPVLYSTFIIGVLFYFVFFWGLQFTSAGNASIVGQMELWFSFIFFGLILRREKYTRSALLGALLMFLGVLFVLFPNFSVISKGDLIILLAVAIPPLGNHYQQLARKKVSAITLLFVRDFIGGIFLLGLAVLFESTPSAANFSAALPLLLINGILLLGVSKIFWIEGIHRISVAKALSLNAVTPVCALIYAYFFLQETPQLYQVLGLLPMLLGVYLILNKKFLRNEEILD